MYSLISALFFTFACDPQSKTDPGTDPNTPEDTGTPNPEEDSPSIFGDTFTLVEVVGIDMDSMYLNISENGDYMSFGSTCNDQEGSLEVTEDTLFFTWESGTEMVCSDEEGQVDGWLSDFFESNPTYTFDGSILELESGDSRLTLEKYVPTALVPLTETKWEILIFTEALDSGGNRSTGNSGSSINPTLRFYDDGTFEVDTGCNQGSGSFSTSEEQMTVEFTSLTEESCSVGTDDFFWGHKDEHILSILQDGPTFFIENFTLYMDANRIGFQAFVEYEDDQAE